jgi:hypothetical protein
MADFAIARGPLSCVYTHPEGERGAKGDAAMAIKWTGK